MGFASGSEGMQRTGVESELEALSRVSSSRSKRKADNEGTLTAGSSQAPVWEPGRPSSVHPDDSASQVSVGHAVTVGLPVGSVPPPPQHAPNLSHLAMPDHRTLSSSESDRREDERRRNTIQLSSLLFPWWETDVAETRVPIDGSHYHLKTRVEGKVGLLIDPGAHDNLIGGNTSRLLAEQCMTKPREGQLTKRLSVAGVGSGGQSTDVTHRIDFDVQESQSGNSVRCAFNAPVIEGSDLPPLLGLKSLKRLNAIVDCGQQLLILPGPAGIKHSYPPGSVVLNLSMSPSGHLILVVNPVNNADSEQVLDFMHKRTAVPTSTSVKTSGEVFKSHHANSDVMSGNSE